MPDNHALTASSTKRMTASADISLFDVAFYPKAVIESTKTGDKSETTVVFSVNVGDRSLGDVLRYIVGLAGGNSDFELDPPWNVLDSISLEKLSFQLEITSEGQRYGFSYSDIGLDLTFLQIDKLDIWYRKGKSADKKSVDVEVYGTFMGISFADKPITWDALKEQPPASPGQGESKFRLDYMGLGQHVTLRNVQELDTIEKVMGDLRGSYKSLDGVTTDPLQRLTALTYDDSAAWLIGAQFSVMETFDLSVIWNLPTLAGLRISLSGERAKSLAGLEFEILYRRIAEDLGVYHMELVLPDVLRTFQAGVASVTLPVIVLDIYTDGGFLIDLGFPHNLDFSRSCSIEMLILGVPVTGALGLYFGVLNEKAVPELPQIVGGHFSPVIVAGVGMRIGVGKSIKAGILSAGLFIGIEGMIEGIVALYSPTNEVDPKGTFYRVSGTLQLTGHIWGEVSFAIIKAKVDVYAYVSASVTFEAYQASLVVFAAGVSLNLTVTVGFGFFSFDVSLSFSTHIRQEITIGQDEATPWKLGSPGSASPTSQRLRAPYRHLPSGNVVANQGFARALAAPPRTTRERRIRKSSVDRTRLELYFHPVATVGLVGDKPGAVRPDVDPGQVTLVANFMTRLSRRDDEGAGLSPGEDFGRAVLLWGLDEVRSYLHEHDPDGTPPPEMVTLSELHFLSDDLSAHHPKIPITRKAVDDFLEERVEIVVEESSEAKADDKLAPFPILPRFAMDVRKDGDVVHHADFGSDPECSPDYQDVINHYFEELSQRDDDKPDALSSSLEPKGESLSMAWLIFVDSFRLILRSCVSSAIKELERFEVSAQERSLRDVAGDCGLSAPEDVRRVAEANVGNASLWAPGSRIYMVAAGVVVGGGKLSTLCAVAGRLDLPLLTTARHLRNQPVLQPDSSVRVTGGRYRLQPADTRESLQVKFKGATWSDIKWANESFDWSVPPKGRPPFVDLDLPAGSTIELPTMHHEVVDGDTLQGIADYYGAPLFGLIHLDDAPDGGAPIDLIPRCTARRCVAFNVKEAESVDELVARAGLDADSGLGLLFEAIKHAPQVLVSKALLDIPAGGQYVIKRGDTLEGITRDLHVTGDALREANPGDEWKLEPEPYSSDVLSMGETIALPAVSGYEFSDGDTLDSIARKFSLADPVALLRDAHDSKSILRPLAEVLVPPVTIQVPDAAGETKPSTPAELASPYAVDPVDFILANQGCSAGQGSDVTLGTVTVPECESALVVDVVESLAGAGDGGSSEFAFAINALSRFLLAGLRLPDPATFTGDEPAEDVDLYPVYTLTGQQWPAPDPTTPSDYEVELSWDGSEETSRFRASVMSDGTADDDSHLTVTLGKLDWLLITGFRDCLQDPETFDEGMISEGGLPYPPLELVAKQLALGTPTLWSVPAAPKFVPDEDLGTDAQPTVQLFPLPEPLRRGLPAAGSESEVHLDVLEPVPDHATGDRRWQPMKNVGYATRLEVKARRVFLEDGKTALKSVYELVSCTAKTQAMLTGLLHHVIEKATDLDIGINLLFAPGSVSHLANSLQSRTIVGDDRFLVSILKSNLSAFSRPPTLLASAASESDDLVGAADLSEGAKFIKLLWQLSVTNSAGFFLDYGLPTDDPGLPDEVFEGSEMATLTFLVTLREALNEPRSIRPRRFHDTLVCAQNLAVAGSTLVVAPVRHTVGTVGSDDQSECLANAGEPYGLKAKGLAILNAATTNLLNVGMTVGGGDDGETSYIIEPGDDLFAVAAQMEMSVGDLGDLIASAEGILLPGAQLDLYPKWVAARSRVPQRLGGLRIIRRAPKRVGGDRGVPEGDDPLALDPINRLERMFNLLSYAVQQENGFRASPHGLPVPPANPDTSQRNGRFSVPYRVGYIDEQPWLYDRLLPIAKWAIGHETLGGRFIDPYAGLGKDAAIAVQLQDSFGNLMPAKPASAVIAWPQRYRDPLLPPNRWPSVSLSYDVERDQTFDAPQLMTRLKFAPAGYVAAPGMPLESVQGRARSDRQDWAMAYYQVAHGRVRAFMQTSLVPHEREVSTVSMAEFAHRCFNYLGVVGQLEAVTWTVADKNETLRTIAGEYQVTVGELARVSQGKPHVLKTGKTYNVPVHQLVMPNTSLVEMIDRSELTLTPRMIGALNPDAPLAPGISLRVGGADVVTGKSSTLRSLATSDAGPGDIATNNAAAKQLFAPNQDLLFGVDRPKIHEGQTLADLAHDARLSVESLAEYNADRRILRKGAVLEIPRHVLVPERGRKSPGLLDRVRQGESLQALTKRAGLESAVRDLATANSDTSGLLAVDAVLVYRHDGSEHSETVLNNDTLSTVTSRFGDYFDLPDLRPADVAKYWENLTNENLLVPTASVLLPPRRLLIPWSLVLDERPNLGITQLAVTFRMERIDPELIDQRFGQAEDVHRVVTEVPPRLSSKHTRDERTTLRAFSKHFNAVFPNLWIATGPDVLKTVSASAVEAENSEERSKMLVVPWEKEWRDFTIHDRPCFFAPRPLVTEPWSEQDVTIFPYVSGEMLPPTELPDPLPTRDFHDVDLERWAHAFLERVDSLLKPDMVAALHSTDPDAFSKLVQIKRDIAKAVSDRIDLILDVDEEVQRPPDRDSARKAFEDQLLVELAPAYRGGTVVQFGSTIYADEHWKKGAAPLVFGQVSPTPSLILPDGENAHRATLDWIAQEFGCSSLLVAEVLQGVEGLLTLVEPAKDSGDDPDGKQVVEEKDTLRSIATKRGVDLPELVQEFRSRSGFLKPGAPIRVIEKRHRVEMDDSFASVILDLARAPVTDSEVTVAIHRFAEANQSLSRVFREGAELRLAPGGDSYKPTLEDSIQDAARALQLPVEQFIAKFYTMTTALRSGVEFRYLSLYPPSALSDAKLELYAAADGQPESKLNVLYVTSSPDDVSSVKLRLSFKTQEMEYNVSRPGLGGQGYRASEWLTFVDWRRDCDLGDVEIPIPNRQFPIPPAIISQDTKQVLSGSLDSKPDLALLPKYNYELSFGFHPAAQDELYYQSDVTFAGGGATAQSLAASEVAPDSIGTKLAQFDAINGLLWSDLEPLRKLETEHGEEPSDVLKKAITVFVGLGRQIADCWASRDVVTKSDVDALRFRIRKHLRPDGAAAVTVCPVGGALRASLAGTDHPKPKARLLGRTVDAESESDLVAHVVHSQAAPEPRPSGESDRYVVSVPDLSVLREQAIRGRLSVARNERLVCGLETRKDFVLHIRDVRPSRAAVPRLLQVDKIDIDGSAGNTFVENLTSFLEELLFTGAETPQLASLGVSFTRPLFRQVEARALAAGSAEPSDTRTMYSPVAITPAVDFTRDGTATPEVMARTLNDYLEQWLLDREIPPNVHWALSLRLFGSREGADAQAPLLELVDLRLRNGTQ